MYTEAQIEQIREAYNAAIKNCEDEVIVDLLAKALASCEAKLKPKKWKSNGSNLNEHIVKSRAEKGEVVGGGYFVFRRGKRTGRIGVKNSTIPFEHGSRESAMAEVARLEKQYPGETFKVFVQYG